MQISEFSSYFELIAVLNAGYAGFESFTVYSLKMLRGRLNDPELVQRLETSLLEQPSNEILSGLKDQRKDLEDELQKSDKTLETLSQTTKPSFIYGAVYCIAILLIGGAEQFWEWKPYQTGELLFGINVTAFYVLLNAWVPESWCFPAISHNNTRRMMVPAVFIGAGFILGLLMIAIDPTFLRSDFSDYLLTVSSVVIAISPCLVNLPKVFGTLSAYNKLVKPIFDKIDDKLKALETLADTQVKKDLGVALPAGPAEVPGEPEKPTAPVTKTQQRQGPKNSNGKASKQPR